MISVASLVEALGRLELLSAAQFDELSRNLARRFPDPQALARELMKRGWLTSYQINSILRDKGSELLLGSYVVLERLGEGGMGQVFKARHRMLDRMVALKVIRKDRLTGPEAIRRFHREIHAVAQLSHPNIVHAYDADQVGDVHFFVMEYVQGTDLQRLVKQHGALTAKEASDYVRQAALGLQHAHEHGLVHRDIKPANLILVEPRSEETVTSSAGLQTTVLKHPTASPLPQVKILDMGLARLTAAEASDDTGELTQTGVLMGTPDYMAPEQTEDSHQVDIRADIYSLGCTCYFLLTGQAPFPGGTLIQKAIRHRLAEPTPIEELRPGLPAGLSAIIGRMMAKRPDQRFQTPAEVAAAIAALHQGTEPPIRTARRPAAAAEDPFTELWSNSALAKSRRPRRGPPWGLIASVGAAILFSGLLMFLLRPGSRFKLGEMKHKPGDGIAAPKEKLTPEEMKRRQEEEEAGRKLLDEAEEDLKPLLSKAESPVKPLSSKEAKQQQEDEAKKLGVPVQMTNSIDMKLSLIPAGRFLMGSPDDEPGHGADEGPQHEVTLTRPFYLGTYEVTQAQYDIVMRNNPSQFQVPTGPVERVSWHDAVAFCQKLSDLPKEKSAGRVYRLPTEAEWEYVCRAGSATAFHYGNDASLLGQYVSNIGPGQTGTDSVGRRLPNAWGIYDMHGNVAEWCSDWYGAEFYRDSPRTNPLGPAEGRDHVVRGGSFRFDALRARSAVRIPCFPDFSNDDLGIRVVCEVKPAVDH